MSGRAYRKIYYLKVKQNVTVEQIIAVHRIVTSILCGLRANLAGNQKPFPLLNGPPQLFLLLCAPQGTQRSTFWASVPEHH